MADIAFIFHWQKESILVDRLGQIERWRSMALTRFEKANGGGD